MTPIHLPIERSVFNTQRLMTEHPPVWRDRNKTAVYEVGCPAGSRHNGELVYSRWRAMPLPLTVNSIRAVERLESKKGYFDYAPILEVKDAIEWHVNFADSRLFVAYSSGLFAQDEMQVAEHPALGALKEALKAKGVAALTEEGDVATPILIMNAERRCRIATDPNSADGRPNGLYGNAFASASESAVRRATTRLNPPTFTNLIAMAAPSGGFGRYSVSEIRRILTTAYTGFRAALSEGSHSPTVVHTGFWGCGAFGGNRVLMAIADARGLNGGNRPISVSHVQCCWQCCARVRERSCRPHGA